MVKRFYWICHILFVTPLISNATLNAIMPAKNHVIMTFWGSYFKASIANTAASATIILKDLVPISLSSIYQDFIKSSKERHNIFKQTIATLQFDLKIYIWKLRYTLTTHS